jgi:membrane-associated PAP2 superfamily phosphatase
MPRTANQWIIALASVGLLAIWDASDLDLIIANVSGDAHGFLLRDHWLFAHLLHHALRISAWVFSVVLCVMAIWPVGPWSRLSLLRRIQAPATALVATALVAVLKSLSGTCCPWDLSIYGGVAQHLSHWYGWMVEDGGRGHCFPAAHATSGFAFIGGYFALRSDMPHLARRWLLGAMIIGLVAGISQQLRGAHFASHTLWTAWLCWMVARLMDPLFARTDQTEIDSADKPKLPVPPQPVGRT